MARRRSFAVVALVVAGLVVPAGSAAQDADELAEVEELDDLDEALDELSDTERQLAEALERLERAEAELDAIDRRIAGAAAELARLEEEVEAAEEAWEAARQDADDAAAAVEEAEARVVIAVELEAESLARLEGRAAEVYKRGTTMPQQFLMRGVAGADDWHQVAVTLRTFDRVLLEDRDVLDDAITAKALAASARDRAELARAEAEAAEERAADELAQVEALREDQAAVVAAAQSERRRQQAIFAELEADAEVMAALRAKLEEQIATLEAGPAPTPEPTPPPDDNGAPAWAVSLPSAGHAWAGPIATASHANNIDGRLMAALVWTESSFNPHAVSPAGAIGLAQLMPGTASWLGVDPSVPEHNLDGGSRYLRMQLDRFGSVELALAAYNAGPTAVASYGGIPPFAETQLYVVRVLERYQIIAG